MTARLWLALTLATTAGCTAPVAAPLDTPATEPPVETDAYGDTFLSLYQAIQNLSSASADVVDRHLNDGLTRYKADKELEAFRAMNRDNLSAFQKVSPPSPWVEVADYMANASTRLGLGLVDLQYCIKEGFAAACDMASEDFWSRDCYLVRALRATPEIAARPAPPEFIGPQDCKPRVDYALTVEIKGNDWVRYEGHLTAVNGTGALVRTPLSGTGPDTREVLARVVCVTVTHGGGSGYEHIPGVLGVFVKRGDRTLASNMTQAVGGAVSVAAAYPAGDAEACRQV